MRIYVVFLSSHISSTWIYASVNLLPFVATQTEIRLTKVDMLNTAMKNLPQLAWEGRRCQVEQIKSKFTELAKKLARGNAPKGEATHDQAMRATTLLIALIHESGAPAAEKRWLLAEILRLHSRDQSKKQHRSGWR